MENKLLIIGEVHSLEVFDTQTMTVVASLKTLGIVNSIDAHSTAEGRYLLSQNDGWIQIFDINKLKIISVFRVQYETFLLVG
jgi:hypothetical protein